MTEPLPPHDDASVTRDPTLKPPADPTFDPPPDMAVDTPPPMAAEAAPDAGADEPADDAHRGPIQRLADAARGSGVGTEDPNIVGDAGIGDAAPGQDPDNPAPTP